MSRASPPSVPPRSVRGPTGFTLVELVTVLAVVALLAALALPSLSTWFDRRRLEAAASTLVADLQHARMEAIVRQEPVRVTALDDGAGGHCLVVHTGQAASCTCSALGSPAARCTQDAAVLRHAHLSAATRVRVDAATPSLQFDPQLGTCTPAGTIALSIPNGDAVHQVVNVMGRVRTCSPAGRMGGHGTC